MRNLRDIAPTIYFNVPKGFEMLLPYLAADRGVARDIFQPAQSDVLRRRRPVAACPRRSPGARGRDHRRAHHVSGEPRLDRDGAAALACSWECERMSAISACRCPAWSSSSCRAKASSRRGLRAPTSRPAIGARRTLTAAAFDEEGFYKIGDALEIRGPRRSGQGPPVRRPPRRGFQARDRHLGQRRAVARGFHRALRSAGARCRVGRRRIATKSPRWSFPTSTPAASWRPILPPDAAPADRSGRSARA